MAKPLDIPNGSRRHQVAIFIRNASDDAWLNLSNFLYDIWFSDNGNGEVTLAYAMCDTKKNLAKHGNPLADMRCGETRPFAMRLGCRNTSDLRDNDVTFIGLASAGPQTTCWIDAPTFEFDAAEVGAKRTLRFVDPLGRGEAKDFRQILTQGGTA